MGKLGEGGMYMRNLCIFCLILLWPYNCSKKHKVCLKKKVILLPEKQNVQQDRLTVLGQFPGRTEVPGKGPQGTECLIYITKVIPSQAWIAKPTLVPGPPTLIPGPPPQLSRYPTSWSPSNLQICFSCSLWPHQVHRQAHVTSAQPHKAPANCTHAFHTPLTWKGNQGKSRQSPLSRKCKS